MNPSIRKISTGYRVTLGKGNPFNRTFPTLPQAKQYAAELAARLSRPLNYP